MGEEIFTSELRLKKFLGINTKMSDTSIDYREASGLQNVVITEESLDQRKGQTRYISTPFTNSANNTTKVITGLYETSFGGTTYQVGTGGDAFKSYSAGAWTNRTGALTITDSADNRFQFVTFLDNAAADIIIGANGVNPPLKWTGSGDATALSSPPGNFSFPVVHKNKLWVVINDIVYFSNFRNGEAWTTSDDIIRFENKGENITGLYKYSDSIIVFQPTQISVITGSSIRDLYTETIVSGDGCQCNYSIQEVESRRYGNILVFLSTEGIIKGFNGSKNLIRLGDPADTIFRSMNRSRFAQTVSANYKKLNQYWLGMTYGNGSQNDQVIVYDYANDHYTSESGRPLSSILYHIGTGIKSNAMAIWNQSNSPVFLTANYDGRVLQQDSGLLDDASTAVVSNWQTAKIDFGTPSHVKMLTDMHIVTTQESDTNLGVSCVTETTSGEANLTIEAVGGLWGEMIWGTGLWSAANTAFSRPEFSPSSASSEDPMFGRYFQFQFNHNSASENMKIEDILIGATDLGMQPQFIES